MLGISWGDSDLPVLTYVRVAVGLRPEEFAKVAEQQAKAQEQLVAVNSRLQAEVSDLKTQLAALVELNKGRDSRMAAIERALTSLAAQPSKVSPQSPALAGR